MRQYFVYRHYNKHMKCIYVGLSTNLNNRQYVHFNKSKWADEIYFIDYCDAKNEITMKILEKFWINKLNPKYNIKDSNYDDVSWMENSVKDFTFVNYQDFKKEKFKYVAFKDSDCKIKHNIDLKNVKFYEYDYYSSDTYLGFVVLFDKDENKIDIMWFNNENNINSFMEYLSRIDISYLYEV